MTTIDGTPLRAARTVEATVLPCNFRSAGRLSNENARTLRMLHEVLARNLTNSLDVYLGTGMEVRLVSLEQLTMDDFKLKCLGSGYVLPCTTRPSSSTVLLEMENQLIFTMVDLLLGGNGAKLEASRELTEIDEEILESVGAIIAQQIERVWPPIGYSLTLGKCLKANMAFRLFPPADKVLRVEFDVSVAGMMGKFHIAFQAALAGHLIRNIRAEHASGKGGVPYIPVASLQKRILDCLFMVSGEIPNLKVSVRDLAQIQPGSVLLLSAPVAGPGKLAVEGKSCFEAAPVRQGKNKAMQLLRRLKVDQGGLEESEEGKLAG